MALIQRQQEETASHIKEQSALQIKYCIIQCLNNMPIKLKTIFMKYKILIKE